MCCSTTAAPAHVVLIASGSRSTVRTSDEADLQRHANVTMTLQVYARATKEADRRAADLVGERFRPRDKRGMEGQVRRKT
jgi:hypothetical protein